MCPLQTLSKCTVLEVVSRPQPCPQHCRVCGVLPPETPGRVSDSPLRWSAELGSRLDVTQPCTSQTLQAQALFPVRVGSFCGGPTAAESWSLMNKSRVVGQVWTRAPQALA